MLLRFASGVPYGFRDRQRFELVPKMTTTKMCKKSSQQSDQSCFCTNTRTTHTRQSKPYRRLGAMRARVVGARGHCCPAATVPVADVFPCGVCCCIAENTKIKSSTEKQSSAIIVHKPKRAATSTRTTHTRQNKPYWLGAAPAGVKAEQALLAWRGAVRSSRGTRPLLSSSDGARSCRNRPRCLMYSSKKQKKTSKTTNTRYLRATLN